MRTRARNSFRGDPVEASGTRTYRRASGVGLAGRCAALPQPEMRNFHLRLIDFPSLFATLTCTVDESQLAQRSTAGPRTALPCSAFRIGVSFPTQIRGAPPSSSTVPLMVSRMTPLVSLRLPRDRDRKQAIQHFQLLHAQLPTGMEAAGSPAKQKLRRWMRP